MRPSSITLLPSDTSTFTFDAGTPIRVFIAKTKTSFRVVFVTIARSLIYTTAVAVSFPPLTVTA